jgi:excisionase family DNA binding protein
MADEREVTAKPGTQEFFSLRDFAQRHGINYRTAHRAAQAGKIKAIRLGGVLRVHKSELDRVAKHGF